MARAVAEGEAIASKAQELAFQLVLRDADGGLVDNLVSVPKTNLSNKYQLRQ